MKNLIVIILFVFFGSIICLYKSCAFKSSKSNYPSLVSEKNIDEFVVNWIKANGEAFNWKYAPDDILYSALMYGDSILSVSYFVEATKDKKELYKQHKTLPPDWIKERDKIITYILEKERGYRGQPSITERELMFPFGKSNKLAVINMKISDPSIIAELRKNYYVELGTDYLPLSLR